MLNIIRDPIWELMDSFINHPYDSKKITTNGLRTCINRPHNLINVKDDTGTVVAQKLSVVTTPFNKDEVKVTINDDILTVTCGKENKVDNKNEEVVYRGISSQTYQFALRLNTTIDKQKISAENKDGILTITMPFKEVEKPLEIAVDVK